MTLAFPKSEQGRKLTRRMKPDKLAAKREEWRKERIAKTKIRELDGNACCNPFHWEWRRHATDKTGMLKSRIRDVLSVHRINYGSHCGKYVPENGITACGFCHDCVQKGVTLKYPRRKLIRLSAHQAMLVWLRKLRDELIPEKWRFEETYQRLETRYGEITK